MKLAIPFRSRHQALLITVGLGIALALTIRYAVYDQRAAAPTDDSTLQTSQPTLPLEASAFDWPHLRGAHYDAVSTETDLADTWPAEGPPVLWTHELGQGYSGFAVVGGKLFTQMQSRTGQYVLCL